MACKPFRGEHRIMANSQMVVAIVLGEPLTEDEGLKATFWQAGQTVWRIGL